MVDRRVSIGLILLAVAVRVAAVLVLQSHTIPRSTYEHGEIAANLLNGRGFAVKFLGADGPTSQQAPLYPAVVAVAYAIGGIGTPRALLILELFQSLLGGALVAGVVNLTRTVAPDRRGMPPLAGLIAALHPTLIYAATHVQVAIIAAVLLTWTLAFACRGRGILAGWMLGGLVLTDPILGLALPGMLWGMIQNRGGVRAAVRPMVATLLISSGLVAPWITRNFRVHGELVLVKSSFGYAFWQGNCTLSQGTDKVVRPSVEAAMQPTSGGLKGINEALWKARHEAGYLDDIALTRADYLELGRHTEPERSRILFRRALEDLRGDFWRYPRLCLRRLRSFVLFDETNPKTRSLIYRIPHLGLTLAAVAGLIRMPRPIRHKLGPTLLTVALIATFHALTIVSARFHVPIEPLLAVWAAGIGARWDQPRRPTTS